ncbi:hypothetical protein ACFX5F_11880 [Flavobacterium sp. ZS1P70]|uniref:Phage protein n=1 Tax=Flavobacterium zhoui TaxID=3230414 RepID=A0ABW6I8P5_9FLAO
MEWYEIIGLIVVWLLGLYVTGKFYEYIKDYFYKNSWKKRKEK